MFRCKCCDDYLCLLYRSLNSVTALFLSQTLRQYANRCNTFSILPWLDQLLIVIPGWGDFPQVLGDERVCGAGVVLNRNRHVVVAWVVNLDVLYGRQPTTIHATDNILRHLLDEFRWKLTALVQRRFGRDKVLARLVASGLGASLLVLARCRDHALSLVNLGVYLADSAYR